MFNNLGWPETLSLLLLALLIFGDRLPKVIGDGLRMVRKLRQMATEATGDLSRELGTDIKLEDMHPKAFIRKHVLSEEDEQALRKPLEGVYQNLRSDVQGVRDEVQQVTSAADLRQRGAPATTTPATAAGRPAGFDLDAT
ncbi:preprotein translocase subunit TatB [Melissospora conviva]|uniref:preprotein translocase subunit TatB n=1 Tax=Melissospora conviva TaxID=3388432 RepID=UPI003B7F9060